MKLLDEKGLTTVWAAIKNTFTSKSDADEKYAKKTDLADYATKSQAMHSMDVYHTETDIQISLKGVNDFPLGFIAINAATSKTAGVMTASDKIKLDGIANGANNYTLPIASDTILGGIKTNYNKTPTGNRFPVELDNKGNAYTTIGGLVASSGTLKHIALEEGSYKTIYESNIQKINTDSNTIYNYSFPKESGTFALTSDIPNVSGLCKLNFVDSPSNCVEGRINMFTTTSRSISLNNITDYGEGLILLLACYSDSSYTIYCTDSDLYYKENLVDGGYKENITREGVFLVTIKGSSVYIYPLQ